MSGLDLTEAIRAAEQSDAVFAALTIRETVHSAVAAAAPVIEAQVRAQIAAEIEADLHSPGRCVSPAIRYGYEAAARIARGES